MQVVFENIKEDFKKYNILSRYIIKIGTPILTAMIIITLIFKMLILTDAATEWIYLIYPEMLEAVKEGLGAVYFGAFLLEVFHIIAIRNNEI